MLSGCEDLLEPAPENFNDIDQMHTDIKFAQGVLMSGYRMLPGYYDNSECATDDAVTNNQGSGYIRIATGGWTSSDNAFEQWDRGFSALQYLNIFLENVDSINWANDEDAAILFNKRMKGEAHGLRALFMYYLLRSHAGYDDNGELLGVPIVTEFIDSDADFNFQRSTFEACMQQLYSDLDMAESLLPMEYNDVASVEDIPEYIQTEDTLRVEAYNRVMGHYSRQLFNKLIAMAVRSRASLLAASPAFQDPSNTTTWEMAANNAAKVIDYVGGVSGLADNGVTYYANKEEIDGLSEGINPPEIIWRGGLSTDNTSQEEQNFPPSLFGEGNINPSQNLVDAFPMANGFPISDSRSNFDPENPYEGRDPRLSHYVIYNGSNAGVSNSVIYTGTNSGTEDGINKEETSTRTGYYLKKRLRMDVNIDPSSTSGKTHYTPRIRYTEIFLNYAEAANEAWGPLGTGTNSYSAYDIVKAIRQRAGIGVDNNDPYLEECASSKDKMRELIQNERRLELSFESFRFWDLRRWKQDLNETAMGYDVDASNKVFRVEVRDYNDYMYYGPIPKSETLKFDNLSQNKGWR
jgi:hypothetical protein